MKKILLLLLLLSFYTKVNAIESIEINNENIIPKFNKEFKRYNYFTTKNAVRINVTKSNDEVIDGEGVHYLDEGENRVIITSSNNETYEINIYKNYNKDNNEEIYLKNLSVEGYDINYDKNITEYFITINDEKYLNIDYELSNDNAYISIEGNGNFNKSNNIIKINVNNDKEYIIHVLKTITVSKIEKETIKELSDTKKEIVSIIIITISCTLVFIFYYISFRSKFTLNI